MPIVGLSLDKVQTYYSKFDPDAGTPAGTKWKIKTLDSRVMGHLRDLATKVHLDPSRPDAEVETSINMEDVNFQTAQFGVEWENLVGEGGKQIECKLIGRRLGGKSYRIVDADVLAQVPLNVVQELAERVRKSNELDEVDAKNSEGPSTPSNSSPPTTA